MTELAVILLYFGAANAWLSRFAGTCTQNSADHLAGLGVVLLAYGLGLALLWRRTPTRLVLILLLPVAATMFWHGTEGLRFVWGVFLQGRSACGLLVDPNYGFDGREAPFALLWLVAGVCLPLALFWRLRRNMSAGA